MFVLTKKKHLYKVQHSSLNNYIWFDANERWIKQKKLFRSFCRILNFSIVHSIFLTVVQFNVYYNDIRTLYKRDLIILLPEIVHWTPNCIIYLVVLFIRISTFLTHSWQPWEMNISKLCRYGIQYIYTWSHDVFSEKD